MTKSSDNIIPQDHQYPRLIGKIIMGISCALFVPLFFMQPALLFGLMLPNWAFFTACTAVFLTGFIIYAAHYGFSTQKTIQNETTTNNALQEKKHSGATRLQTFFRKYIQKQKYTAIRQKSIKVQSLIRMFLQKIKFTQRKQYTTLLQAFYRGGKQKSVYAKQKQNAIKIQSIARMSQQKNTISQRKKQKNTEFWNATDDVHQLIQFLKTNNYPMRPSEEQNWPSYAFKIKTAKCVIEKYIRESHPNTNPTTLIDILKAKSIDCTDYITQKVLYSKTALENEELIVLLIKKQTDSSLVDMLLKKTSSDTKDNMAPALYQEAVNTNNTDFFKLLVKNDLPINKHAINALLSNSKEKSQFFSGDIPLYMWGNFLIHNTELNSTEKQSYIKEAIKMKQIDIDALHPQLLKSKLSSSTIVPMVERLLAVFNEINPAVLLQFVIDNKDNRFVITDYSGTIFCHQENMNIFSLMELVDLQQCQPIIQAEDIQSWLRQQLKITLHYIYKKQQLPMIQNSKKVIERKKVLKKSIKSKKIIELCNFEAMLSELRFNELVQLLRTYRSDPQFSGLTNKITRTIVQHDNLLNEIFQAIHSQNRDQESFGEFAVSKDQNLIELVDWNVYREAITTAVETPVQHGEKHSKFLNEFTLDPLITYCITSESPYCLELLSIIAKVFKKNKKPINTPCESGTVLNNVLKVGSIKVATVLVNAGADVNICDSKERNALFAFFYSLQEIYPTYPDFLKAKESIELLNTIIKNTTDLKKMDHRGLLPLNWGFLYGFHNIIAKHQLRECIDLSGFYKLLFHPVPEDSVPYYQMLLWQDLNQITELIENIPHLPGEQDPINPAVKKWFSSRRTKLTDWSRSNLSNIRKSLLELTDYNIIPQTPLATRDIDVHNFTAQANNALQGNRTLSSTLRERLDKRPKKNTIDRNKGLSESLITFKDNNPMTQSQEEKVVDIRAILNESKKYLEKGVNNDHHNVAWRLAHDNNETKEDAIKKFKKEYADNKHAQNWIEKLKNNNDLRLLISWERNATTLSGRFPKIESEFEKVFTTYNGLDDFSKYYIHQLALDEINRLKNKLSESYLQQNPHDSDILYYYDIAIMLKKAYTTEASEDVCKIFINIALDVLSSYRKRSGTLAVSCPKGTKERFVHNLLTMTEKDTQKKVSWQTIIKSQFKAPSALEDHKYTRVQKWIALKVLQWWEDHQTERGLFVPVMNATDRQIDILKQACLYFIAQIDPEAPLVLFDIFGPKGQWHSLLCSLYAEANSTDKIKKAEIEVIKKTTIEVIQNDCALKSKLSRDRVALNTFLLKTIPYNYKGLRTWFSENIIISRKQLRKLLHIDLRAYLRMFIDTNRTFLSFHKEVVFKLFESALLFRDDVSLSFLTPFISKVYHTGRNSFIFTVAHYKEITLSDTFVFEGKMPETSLYLLKQVSKRSKYMRFLKNMMQSSSISDAFLMRLIHSFPEFFTPERTLKAYEKLQFPFHIFDSLQMSPEQKNNFISYSFEREKTDDFVNIIMSKEVSIKTKTAVIQWACHAIDNSDKRREIYLYEFIESIANNLIIIKDGESAFSHLGFTIFMSPNKEHLTIRETLSDCISEQDITKRQTAEGSLRPLNALQKKIIGKYFNKEDEKQQSKGDHSQKKNKEGGNARENENTVTNNPHTFYQKNSDQHTTEAHDYNGVTEQKNGR